MTINKGYNDKATHIRISGKSDSRVADLWIEQPGFGDRETLSFVTVDELLDLKEEIDRAILEIVKIDRET